MLTALVAALALAQTVEIRLDAAAGDRVTVRKSSTMNMDAVVRRADAPGPIRVRREETETKEYELEVLAVADGLPSEGRVRFVSCEQRTRSSVEAGGRTQEQPEEVLGASLAGCVFLLRRGGDPERTPESGEPDPEDLEDVNADLLGRGAERSFLPGGPVAVGDSWPLTAEGIDWLRRSLMASSRQRDTEITEVEPAIQVRLDRIEETDGRRLAHLAITGEATLRGTAREENLFGDADVHPLRIRARFTDAVWVIDLTASRPSRGAADLALEMTFGPEDNPVATFDMSGHTENVFTWPLDR